MCLYISSFSTDTSIPDANDQIHSITMVLITYLMQVFSLIQGYLLSEHSIYSSVFHAILNINQILQPHYLMLIAL